MPQLELFPAIVGVFTAFEVDVFATPPQAPPVDLEFDTSNAKIMVFQTSKNTYHMFISGGSDNGLLLSGCSTRTLTIRMCKEDALVWYITLFGLVEYCVKFANPSTVEKFSSLVNLWGCSSSNALGTEVDATSVEAAVHVLRGHILKLAAHQYDDEENAFAEIDMLTSSFALFQGSA